MRAQLTSSNLDEKRAAAWNLDWENVVGAGDEDTVPEAIVLAALFPPAK